MHSPVESLRQFLLRYRRRHDPSFLNKCDFCGLRVEYTGDSFDESAISIGALDKLGLARYSPRRIYADADRPTEFCALGHVREWNEKHVRCRDWLQRLPGSTPALSDYLLVHHSRVIDRNATRLQVALVAIAILAFGLSAYGIWLAHDDSAGDHDPRAAMQVIE